MKKTLLLTSTLILLLACETGVKKKNDTNEVVLSGIVDRSATPQKHASGLVSKSQKQSFNKIFSNSAQPGFYLQMAVFEKNRPSKSFLKPLDRSAFNYIVLNKYNKDYVLIGPYKSYNSAKSKVDSVKSTLGKSTFVVQVLRP